MKFEDGFLFLGKSSQSLGLVLVSQEKDPNYDLGLSRDIVAGEKVTLRTTNNIISTKYAKNLSFSFMLCKDPDVTAYSPKFSTAELREITSWLTSTRVPQIISFTGQEVYYYGVFTDVEPFVVSGNLVGIQVTFTCNAPYAFSEEYTTSITGGSSKVIENTTDAIDESVYPIIIVEPTATGEVTITNHANNKSIALQCQKSNTLTIDARNLTITDKAGIVKYSTLGWSTTDIMSFWWPELLPGDNQISVSGNANVTLKYRFPRKVGEF